MAENSKIEWTTHTFNPWRGCTKISDGCKNCYADTLSKRNPGTLGTWGPNGTRVVASESMWKQPLKWNRDAEALGYRPRVFCASLADVFEDWLGPMVFSDGRRVGINYDKHQSPEDGGLAIVAGSATMQDIRNHLFELIDATPTLDWLLLTKRPESIRRMWSGVASPDDLGGEVCTNTGFRHNVWLLTSVENQEQANKRIPELLKCRDLSPVLGLSCEPLLGPVDLSNRDGGRSRQHWNWLTGGYWQEMWDGDGGLVSASPTKLDWVIAGGESGPNARPMHPKWARSLRDQCNAAGVPFFMKQMGGVKKPFPEITDDLFVRQFPNMKKGG
jgi:protein gp37